MTAKLSIGGELAFGGLTALALWQLPDAAPPNRLHVVVADNRDTHSTDDIYVQRRSVLLTHTFVRAGWQIVSGPCRDLNRPEGGHMIVPGVPFPEHPFWEDTDESIHIWCGDLACVFRRQPFCAS